MLTRIKDYFWTRKTVKLIKKHGLSVEVDGKRGKAFFNNTHADKILGWFMPADGSVYLRCVWADRLEPAIDDYGKPFVKVHLTTE